MFSAAAVVGSLSRVHRLSEKYKIKTHKKKKSFKTEMTLTAGKSTEPPLRKLYCTLLKRREIKNEYFIEARLKFSAAYTRTHFNVIIIIRFVVQVRYRTHRGNLMVNRNTVVVRRVLRNFAVHLNALID